MMKHLRLVLLTFFTVYAIGNLYGQVTANFTYSATTGCGSLQVSFCDNSVSTAGDIVAWSWNLGGAPSSIECPGRVFGIPGNYTICLTATDVNGNTGTKCITDLIKVFKLPEPDFVATPIEGCAPAEISFNDLSTSQDAPITSWLWGLGGSCGTIFSTNPGAPAAVCNYTIPDDYTISLTVTDANGCSKTKTKTDYLIISPAPEALFSTIDTFGCSPPYTATFTNNSPITSGINFSWDFGPGNGTYNGVNPPPVSFNTSGAHTVTLIATSSLSNCSDTFSIENVVEVGYDVNFNFTPASGCKDMVVSFTDLSLNAADNVIWDFGDGITSNDPNPTHQYTTPGCYYVKLSRKIGNCWSEKFSSTCINVTAPPAVTYNNDNNVGCTLPHVVNFAGTSASAISWEWDFGDNTTSTLQNPTHVYNTFGEYPVKLTVTNASGCKNSVIINTIKVQPVVASLIDDQIEGCAPMTITLGENSSSVTPIVSWSWKMTTTSSTYISSSPSPTFTVNDIGVFNVQLTVVNTLGCYDVHVFPGAVSVGSIPNLAFSATPTESCVETPITFTDLSSSNVDFWYWDFGDGNSSGLSDPVYSYMDTGYYDVNLIASHNGCVNSITYPDYIHITAPVSKYNIIKFCDNTYQRKFKNNSIGADSIFWDFGVPGINTDTSMQANPEFVYPDTGYFYVTQTVFNHTTGCQHSRTEEIHITDPKANFTLSSNQGCAPMTVSLIDNSEFAETYTWSSPNGMLSSTNTADPTISFNSPGAYSNIQLIVKDENNCRDTFVLTDQIFVNAITPVINADPASGCPTLDVSFSDASSSLFTNNVSWNWTFGNNLGTSSLENPSFSFPDVGNYDVELTVTDEWGCTATATFDNAVQVSSATAFFDADNIGCTSAGISFSNFSDGDGLSYSWDFGDGSPLSTEESPIHFYLNEGTFTVCLTITDINSCESSMCLDNYIEITDPASAFTLDNNFASCPPLVVNFQNLSINATDYLWDFGDGSGLSNLPNPTHVYTTPGSFEVTLISSNSPNCHDTLTFDNLVVLDGPVGEFSYNINSACVPAEITFMASSYANYKYTWDFGNGDVVTNPGYIQSDTFTYIYTEAGTFTPTLSLENNTGCFRTLPEIGSIHVSTLNPEFMASDTLLCDDNVPVTFYNFSSSMDDITSVNWIFQGGNPTNSSDFEEIVSFNSSGSFDVIMIVSNGFCTDTLTKQDYINIGPKPTADFQISVTEGCEPLQVSFTDQSTISSGTLGGWDWDFNDGSGSNQTNPTHVFSAGMNTPITLIVTSQEGCTDTLTQTIDVFDATAVSLSGNQSICQGEKAYLQAQILGDTTGGVTYSWSPSTGLSCTDCLNPIATPLDTITYTFSLTNAGGCVTTEEVTVIVRPYAIPNVQITPDTTICANSIIQLYVSGGYNVYSYNWDTSQPGLSCYTSCFNPIASPLDTTTYTVTVTNQYGCSNQGAVTINVLDETQPFLGVDRTICEGASIQLNTSIGNNPIWLVTDGLSCSACPDPIASPDVQTTYYAQVTTDFGCKILDTLVVNIMTQEDIDAGENIEICRGETIVLNGVGEGTVNWTPNINMTNSNTYSPEVTPNASTTYFMTVTLGDCTIRDSVKVVVTDKTNIDLEDVTICEGEEVELMVEGRADTYDWSPSPDLSSLTIENPLASPISTTTFTVIATLATCEPDTASAMVTVIPAPIISVNDVIDYFPGQEVKLDVSVTGPGIYAYDWSPVIGISCITCSNPVVTPNEEGYTVVVTDLETGCSSEETIRFNLLDGCPEELISVPNIFTPNNDGVNDRIGIFLSPTLSNEIYSFRIFNRWGSLVFETTDANKGWDGTFKDRELPEGVYIYLVEAPCEFNGGRIVKKGDFLLLR